MRTIRTIFLLILILVAGDGWGQDLPSRTASGVLIGRHPVLSSLEALDGRPESASCDASRLRQIIHELNRSADDSQKWQQRPLPRRFGHNSRVDLACIWAGIDRWDQDGGVMPARVFAFAPLVPDVYHGRQLQMRLSTADVIIHEAAAIGAWFLDADDGQGWRPIVPGIDIPVSYAATGTKELRLKAEGRDGQVVFARSTLQVKRLVTPDPDDTWFITATESYGGSAGTGLAHLYLAEDHLALENPIVVVEGFDLDDSMDWPVLYEFLNQENLLEDLRARGFDAVVLDFTEATAPIQRNAFVLTRLLQQTGEAVGPETPLQVVGASMGGLVSRYALTWLENQGVDHGVQTFISFDSPQAGANIPLGLQHWLDFFAGESAEAGFLLSRLNSPAARQMLVYHHEQPQGGSPGADPLFAALRSDLLALGNWPQLPRLVAVANGSGSGQDQGFAAGEQIIFYEYRSALADIDGNVWSVPLGGPQVIFDGMIDLLWPLPDTYETVTVGGTLPWDNAPGGRRPSMDQMAATPVPYGTIEALHGSHCFIPTISALALDVADPFFDIAAAPDLGTLSPFDALYFPGENQEHIAITPENKEWLMTEALAVLSPVDDGGPPVPVRDAWLAVYPNPFNPATTLRFALNQPGPVDLEIFDLKGRRVKSLLRGAPCEAGEHDLEWRGRDDRGRALPAGVYFGRLTIQDRVFTQRMVLVK